MDSEIIYKIYSKLLTVIDPLKVDLIYNSDFELLIAVILSARTTDKNVNNVTQKLFFIANTPEKMISIKYETLKKYIKKVGFYNKKARNILTTCKILIEKYKSKIPGNRKDLEDLPGIGRKSANVILNLIFNQPVIAVDTHVYRVTRRLNLAKESNIKKLEIELQKNTPDQFLKIAGNLLLLHGRYTCKAKKPKCNCCILNEICEYFKFIK